MGELFDDVARTLATTPSRRRAIGTIAGTLASAALVSLWPRAVAAKTCPPGQVLCGPTQQCLPTSGTSWTCCGYTGSPGSGSACGPGGCNTQTGVCCANTTHGKPCGKTCTSPGGQCCDPSNGVVCGAGQSCCPGAHSPNAAAGCCPAGTQCKNGQCLQAGSGSGGHPGGQGGQPGGGQSGQPPTSCPPGAALCGTGGQCCPTSGVGQCCGTGSTASCCWGGTCINGRCVFGQPTGGGRP